MRSRRIPMIPLYLLVAMASAVPAAGQATQDTSALSDALRAARGSLATAYDRLDPVAATGLFTADGVVEFQGQVITGPDAIQAWYAEAFTGVSALRVGASTFVVSDDEVTERSGYVVILTDGQEQGGSAESVWRRQDDGSWKLVRLVVM